MTEAAAATTHTTDNSHVRPFASHKHPSVTGGHTR